MTTLKDCLKHYHLPQKINDSSFNKGQRLMRLPSVAFGKTVQIKDKDNINLRDVKTSNVMLRVLAGLVFVLTFPISLILMAVGSSKLKNSDTFKQLTNPTPKSEAKPTIELPPQPEPIKKSDEDIFITPTRTPIPESEEEISRTAESSGIDEEIVDDTVDVSEGETLSAPATPILPSTPEGKTPIVVASTPESEETIDSPKPISPRRSYSTALVPYRPLQMPNKQMVYVSQFAAKMATTAILSKVAFGFFFQFPTLTLGVGIK